MTSSIIVTSPAGHLPAPPPAGESAELLRQLVDLQKEQLAATRALHAGPHERARWRAIYGRHEADLPGLPADTKRVLPAVEKCYLTLLAELTEKLAEPEALENEYAAAELLDRYSQRLAQLGNLLGQLGQLAALAE